LRMIQSEQANAGRLNSANQLLLLSTDAPDAKTLIVVLSLALSVPMESLYGGEAKAIAYKARQSFLMLTQTNIKASLQQKTQTSLQAAAVELKQAEGALGQLPENLAALAEQLQKASNESNWRDLITKAPVVAMVEPTPTPAAMIPEPALEPTPVEPEVKIEPEMKPVKPEPVAVVNVVTKESPKVVSTAVKTEPKLDDKTIKTNALALYKEGKFEKAAVEAKKSKKLEGLGKQIEEFSSKYASVKSKYAAGERANIYETAKRVLSLDATIASAYQAEIKAWIGPCADARARQIYNTAESAKPPASYGLFRDSYVVALDANRNGVTKESGPIIKTIDADVSKKMAAGKAAENKGKNIEAINYYDIITQYVPASTQAHNDAKKASERLKAQQGGL
jgi:hypothetical protein